MFSKTALCLLLAPFAVAAQSLPEKLIEAGHWKQARNIVEATYRNNPNDALANFLLSQIRNAFHDTQSPMALAEKAVALDAGVAKYHRQLAEVMGVMAQRSGPLRQLVLARRFKKEIDTALALDGRDLQAWRDLMEFYLRAPGIMGGDKARARSAADRIAGIDAAEGFLAQARLAEFDNESGALERLYVRAVESRPGSYRARIALSSFYLSSVHQNFPMAEKHSREAIKIDRGRADAYAILADVYASRAQWREMDSILAIADNDAADDLLPHFRAADRILASGRDLPRAEAHFRRYLDAEPEGNAPTSEETRHKLGLVLQRTSHTSTVR
jgi:hypothetical protein